MLRLVLGFLCGVVATGPMSVAMVLLHRRLPAAERYPLPPREITAKTTGQITKIGKIDSTTCSVLTWIAHFAYGGAAGAIYAGVEPRLPGRCGSRGLIFGLLVWVVSYLGLLPVFQILTSPTSHPLRRNALMIAAHLVWGTFAAIVYEVLFGDLRHKDAAFNGSVRPPRDAQSQ